MSFSNYQNQVYTCLLAYTVDICATKITEFVDDDCLSVEEAREMSCNLGKSGGTYVVLRWDRKRNKHTLCDLRRTMGEAVRSMCRAFVKSTEREGRVKCLNVSLFDKNQIKVIFEYARVYIFTIQKFTDGIEIDF